MIRLVEDAGAVAEPFLAGLNACFPGWGGRDAFDWCFVRTAGATAADLLIAEQDGALAAGSAVTYRRLRRGDGREQPVACMTGSWTLPAARGRGLFKAMIDQSLGAARERGCGLLVGYGAAANLSYAPLAARSAKLVDAAFLTSPGAAVERIAALEPVSGDEAVRTFAARTFDPAMSRLVYRPDEWRGQMLERPWPTEALRLPGGPVAVVERRPGVDRLLDVSTSDTAEFLAAVELAAAASHGAGRRLSTYTLDPDIISALLARGFASTPACFYLLLAGDESVADARWWFANGDRM